MAGLALYRASVKANIPVAFGGAAWRAAAAVSCCLWLVSYYIIINVVLQLFSISKLLKYFVNSLLTPVYWLTHRKVRDNRLKPASSDSGKHSTSDMSSNTWNFISVFKYYAAFSESDETAELALPVEEDNFNCGNLMEDNGDTADLKQPSKEVNSGMPNLISGLAGLSTSKFLMIMGLIGAFLNKTFIYTVVYPAFRLVFGTLYPAYASYKAVKTKNVKEYVKWMMYWIVFALFTCTETFTDIFLSWFPFYYEIKIILVIWLLSPATKGSSILYRKFVHPMLSSREQEIDDYISKAKEQSYRQVLDLGQKGVTVLMQTAIKSGGGIVNQLKKSYSLGDLSDPTNDGNDETDDVLVTDPRLIRRRKAGRSPHRSSSASASVYFSEVDVVAAGSIINERISEVRSIEDISSGYSSGEGLYAAHQPLQLQGRDSAASQRTNSLTRSRSTRVTRSSVPKKSGVASDDSDENELFDTNIIFLNDKVKKIDKLIEKHESSSSETEFFDIPGENNGFQLHGSERGGSNNTKVTPNTVALVQYNPQHCSERSANLCDLRYDDDIKITACKSDPSCSSAPSLLNFNLSKLSAALSSLYPSPARPQIKGDELDSITKPNQPHNNSNKTKDTNTDPESSREDSTSKKTHIRGGKYNKKHAPQPPAPPKAEDHPPANPIKAKLVLQPGVLRSLSASAESLDKEIFVNYSQKIKRKITGDSTLLKMLRFPRKMAHLNIPGRVKEKRHSWGEFFHAKNFVDTKIQSKSASNLDTVGDADVAKPLRRGGSQVSIGSLTEPPVAHRRLKVVRRCAADKDTD